MEWIVDSLFECSWNLFDGFQYQRTDDAVDSVHFRYGMDECKSNYQTNMGESRYRHRLHGVFSFFFVY